MSHSEDEIKIDGTVFLNFVSEDVKIDVTRQTRMERRNPNLATSSSSQSLEEENYNSTHRLMDLDLYKAATKDDVDGFIDALERISNEKELPLSAIFEQVSPSGNTLLHIAASLNNCKTVPLIINHAPWLLSKKNSKGDTPLHILARAGHRDTVMKLVSNLERYEQSYLGNDNKPESESTAFSLCLRAQNDEGNTALHEALIHGHKMLAFSLIFVLMQDPEALYYLNKEGKSPLYLATEACLSGCVNLMLNQIIEFEIQFGRLKGKSPVHAAIMKQNTGIYAVINFSVYFHNFFSKLFEVANCNYYTIN